jgi:WD40 repeat protein
MDNKDFQQQIIASLQSNDQVLENLVNNIRKLRSNVNISSLSEHAETQLRQIFSLPEKIQAQITGRRIINLLQFEDMHERFDDISEAHNGTFAWALDDRSVHESKTEGHLRRHSQDVVDYNHPSGSSSRTHNPDAICVAPLLIAGGQNLNPRDDSMTANESSNLSHWLKTGAGVFHLTGIPGSGKSTLMKFLWDHPKTMSYCDTWAKPRKLVTAKYFLWKRGTKKQKTIGGLCRSLLHDILEECVELVPKAMPELWKQTVSMPWQVELKYHLRKDHVCRALTQLLRDPTISPTHCFVIFIDGLDELEEENSDYEDLVRLILQWTQSSPKHVKLCVSSRPLQEFLGAFPQNQRLLLNHHTCRDHNLVLLDRLQALISTEDKSPSSQQLLDINSFKTELFKFTDHIIQICSGDFRKLSWVLKEMKQMTHAELDPASATGRFRSLSTHDLDAFMETLHSLEATFSQLSLDDWPDHTYGFSGTRSILDAGKIVARGLSPAGAAYRLLSETSDSDHEESLRRRQIQEIETHLDISGSLEDDLFAAKDARMKGTCEWFSTKLAYRDWRDFSSQTPRLLWVTGKPAAGKSTLAGHVIEELQNKGEVCSFYFFKYANPSKSLVSTCLRSLACQMASQQVSVREKLWEVLQETAGLVSENNNDRLLWHKLFLNTIFKAGLEKCFWVIDGLDECENAVAAFRTILSDLNGTIPLRILVTSRDTQTLRTAFAELGPQQYRHEAISTLDTLPDIRAFVETRSKTLISMNDETRAALVKKVVAKSEGSFLWTSLVLKELSHAYSEDEINQVLEEIPRDMDPLYRRTLDMMSRSAGTKHIAKSIITWTTCATRPLKLIELEGALKFTGHDKISNLEAMLQATCGQLVMVDRLGNVQLVHETAREFLLNQNLDSEFAVDRVAANTQLAKACLGYLTSDEMRRPRLVRRLNVSAAAKKQIPFSNYACFNFSSHLLQANSDSTEIIEPLTKFLGANVLTWIEVVARTRNLTSLVQASKHLKKYLTLCTAPGDLHFIQTWSTDLIRISARFADALVACPPAIFALIPPLCPTNSAIYKSVQQGRGLHVLGFSDAEWGNRLTCVDFRSPTSSLCHGHDYFAVGLSNGAVVLYHAGTGQEYKTLHHGEAVNLLCFLNRSGLMASCGPKTIRIWNIGSGEATYTFQAPQRCVALAYDNGFLIAACDKNYLASWNLNNEGCRQPDRQWHAGEEFADSQLRRPPSAVSISLEHKMLAIASPGRPIILWSLEDDDYYGSCGKKLANGEPSKHLVTGLVFNPNPALELLVVSYLDGELVLLDPFNDETLETVRANCPKLAASPDGRLIAGAAGAGTIDIYGFESLNLLYRIKSSNLYVKQLDFSKDSFHFVDIRGSQCNVWEPAALRRASIVWERNDTPESFVESHGLNSKARVNAVVLPDGQKHIVCGKHDGSVVLYDIETASETTQMYRHKSRVHLLAYWKTNGAIISIDESNSVIAWSMPTATKGGHVPDTLGEEIFSFRLDSRSTITQLLPSADTGRFILSTRESDHLWLFHEPKEITGMSHDTSSVRKWVQHPKLAEIVLHIDGNSVRIYKWYDWSLVSSTSISIDITGFQMKHVIPYMIGRDHKLLLEVSELHGGADTRGVYLLDLAQLTATPVTSASQSKPTIAGAEQSPICTSSTQLPPCIVSLISYIIGLSETQKLIFLDRQSWVCSFALDQKPGKSVQYTRHFFVPFDWFSGSRGIVATISGRNVIFAKNDGIAVVYGGFDFTCAISILTK